MRRKLDVVKLKCRGKWSTGESVNVSNSSAFSALRTSLDLFKEVAGLTGVPGLQAGVKALVILLDTVQKTAQNADDVQSLAERIEGLAAMLTKATNEGPLSANMRDRVDRLARTWTLTVEKVQTVASRNYFTRFVNHDSDAQAIAGHISTISWSIQSFTVEGLIAMELAFEAQGHFVREATDRIEGKVDTVQGAIQGMTMGFNYHGGLAIPRAINARFECIDKEPCFAGTRADILSKIYHWIDLGDSMGDSVGIPRDKMDTARVFWMNGPGSAGTGKSTIAYTVAQWCKERDILGASFFCSRDDAECSNPKLIFTTIVSQLASFHDQFKTELLKALQSDPDIVYSGVSYQLDKLLVKPLLAVRTTFPFCIVVIDALDECKDDHTTSMVLSSLAHHIGDLSPIKFLITSRPEQNIVGGFELANLNAVTQRLILHEVNSDVVEKDIHNYLVYHLNRIQKAYGLLSWPAKEDVQLLTHLSAGLFLFAAVAAKFIEHPNYSNPEGQLAHILQSTVPDSGSLGSLDNLYMQVLQNAFPDTSAGLAKNLRIVLGAVVLLQEPLSPFDLQQLFSKLKISVRGTLRQLHAVVIVPEDDMDVLISIF